MILFSSGSHGRTEIYQLIRLSLLKKEKKVAGRIPAVYVSSPVGVIGNTNLIAVSDKRSVVEN